MIIRIFILFKFLCPFSPPMKQSSILFSFIFGNMLGLGVAVGPLRACIMGQFPSEKFGRSMQL